MFISMKITKLVTNINLADAAVCLPVKKKTFNTKSKEVSGRLNRSIYNDLPVQVCVSLTHFLTTDYDAISLDKLKSYRINKT